MLRDVKILVADPSAYLAGLTAAMLRGVGAQSVTVVDDSAAVLVALHRETFDVLVIDDMLAPIDGVALSRQIRATADDNRSLPIVMVFIEADRQRIEAARDAGVTEFIRKPMSGKILDARITQALERPRAFVEAPAYVGPDRRRRSVTVGRDRRQ
jgi:DNA-binding response OmpR family regulator